MTRRHPTGSSLDLAVAGTLALGVAVAEVALHQYLTRPFWYDEIWRAHFASVPTSQFWPDLATANTPSSAGWIGLTRLLGLALGWHVWVLRLPEFVTLPALGAAVYLLIRRFTGRWPAAVGAAALAFNGTVLDLGTQLKPYPIEAIVAVAVVGLWMSEPGPAPDTPTRTLLARRSTAGLLTLFTVPLAFLVVPLAGADALASPRGQRRRALATSAPALALSAAHTVLFVGHQSGQRHSIAWDPHFLAHRSLPGSLAFVWRHLVTIAGGTPPGIDRYDGNLVHAATDHTPLSAYVIAPAVAVAWLVGGRALARRRDGRVVLGALLGAEALELFASDLRYWPFGATRVNLFLVPLIVLVTTVGAATALGWLGQRAGLGPALRLRRGLGLGPAAKWRPATIPAVAAGLVLVIVATGVGASLTGTDRLWRQRHRVRGTDFLVAATVTTRRLALPGDLVVVTGRLARPGWTYAMEASDDSARVVAGAAPMSRVPLRRLARVSPADTVFEDAPGNGAATRVLRARRGVVRGVLLFVLDIDRRGTARALGELRADGWCPWQRWDFPRTGTLDDLSRCGQRPPGESPAGPDSAVLSRSGRVPAGPGTAGQRMTVQAQPDAV